MRMKTLFVTAIILLAILGAALFMGTAFGADTGFVPPDIGADDAGIGTATWSSTENITTSDDVRASATTGFSTCSNTVTDIRLVEGGVISGDDKATGQAFNTLDATVTAGGATDLWGVTLTVDDVNAVDFGYGVSITGQSATTHYITATDFDLTIPAGATIDGVEVSFEGGCSSAAARMDYMSLKIYYTEAATPTRQTVIKGGTLIKGGIIIN